MTFVIVGSTSLDRKLTVFGTWEEELRAKETLDMLRSLPNSKERGWSFWLHQTLGVNADTLSSVIDSPPGVDPSRVEA